MSTDHGPDVPSDPTGPEERVRGLLRALGDSAVADATGTPSATPVVPAEVARQLESRLAELQEERRDGAGPGGVAPLRPRAPRSRRARVTGAAAAAAVLVGLGAGGVAALGGHLAGGSTASSSSSASGVESTDARTSAAPTGGPTAGPTAATPGPLATPLPTGGDLPLIRSASFARDVETLLGGRATLVGPSELTNSSTPPTPTASVGAGARAAAPTSSSAPCTPPRTTPGSRTLPVALDRRPAVLVLGPVRAGARSATVFACGGRAPLASARVAAPPG